MRVNAKARVLGQLRVQLPGSDAEKEKMGANEREQ